MASTLPVLTFFCGEQRMFGPGEYVPDPTEGIVNVNDLPAPTLVAYDRNHDHSPCPRCGHLASRHKSGQRTLHDLGNLYPGCPVDLLVTSSSHYGSQCQKSLNIDLSDVALPGSHSTRRVIQLALRLGAEDGLPYRPASWHLWRDPRVFVPFATLQHWTEAGGKKSARADGRRISGLGACDVFGLCGGR
jgi:hypothetical protein